MALLERTPPPSNAKRRSPRKLSMDPTSSSNLIESSPTRARSLHATSSSSTSHSNKQTASDPQNNPFVTSSKDGKLQSLREGDDEETGGKSQQQEEEQPMASTSNRKPVDYDERPISGNGGGGYNFNFDDHPNAFKDSRRDAMRDDVLVPSASPQPQQAQPSERTPQSFNQENQGDVSTPKQSRVPSREIKEEKQQEQEQEEEQQASQRAPTSRSTSAQPQSQPRIQSQIPRAIHSTTNPASINSFRSSNNGPIPPPSISKNPNFAPSASTTSHRSVSPLKARPNVINTPMTPAEKYNPVVRAERVASLELAKAQEELASLKRQLNATEKKLKTTEGKKVDWQTEAEGWKDECEQNQTKYQDEIAGLESKNSSLQRRLQDAEMARVESKFSDEGRLLQAMGVKEKLRDANCELVLSRNEITYQTGRAIEFEIKMKEEQYFSSELQSRLLKAKKKIKQFEQTLEELSTEKQLEIDELRDENLALEEQLEKSEENSGKNGEAQSQIKELNQELKASQRETAKFRKDLEKENKKVEKFEALREKDEEEKEELKSRVEELERQIASRAAPHSPAVLAKSKASRATGKAAAATKKRKNVSKDSEEEAGSAAEEQPEDEFEESPRKSSKSKAVAKVPPRKRRDPMQGASDFDLRSSPPVSFNKKRGREPIEEEDEIGAETEAKNSPSPRKNPVASSSTSRQPTATSGSKSTSKKRVEEPEELPAAEREEENDEDDFIEQPKKSTVKGKVKSASSSTSRVVPKQKSLEQMADVQATPMIAKVKSKKESKETAPAGDGAQPAKKKKIKLLGGGGGMSGWNNEGSSSLAPKLDIPMELSPLKSSNPHAMRPPGNKFGGGSGNFSSMFGGSKGF